MRVWKSRARSPKGPGGGSFFGGEGACGPAERRAVQGRGVRCGPPGRDPPTARRGEGPRKPAEARKAKKGARSPRIMLKKWP